MAEINGYAGKSASAGSDESCEPSRAGEFSLGLNLLPPGGGVGVIQTRP